MLPIRTEWQECKVKECILSPYFPKCYDIQFGFIPMRKPNKRPPGWTVREDYFECLRAKKEMEMEISLNEIKIAMIHALNLLF
mmetsp:Transcript_38966/g.81907  ORF Transcript_38966/g.81907 Transcript_38966/m.81907 type:complete len:83 (-) Transcript_38966:517-765(-)